MRSERTDFRSKRAVLRSERADLRSTRAVLRSERADLRAAQKLTIFYSQLQGPLWFYR